jgi:Arc/MetJ-type ribon-helix-helix transcriptional regulator
MKSIVIAGQKTKAYCPDCGNFGPATYSYGSFPFDSGIVAENVMRATCDRCGIIVALAHQSANVLKEALQKPKVATTMRLPQELLDFVSLQLDRVGARPNQYDLFLNALLMACRGREEVVSAKLATVQDPVLTRPNSVTINLTFTPRLHQVLTKLSAASSISNLSEVIRRLIVLAEEQPLAKAVSTETERLALALA